MATNTFNTIHSLRRRHHSIDSPRVAAAAAAPNHSSHSLFLTPKSAVRRLSHSAAAAAASTTTNPSTSGATGSGGISLGLLERCLSSKDFRQADEETRRLLIVLAGEAAVRRGYVFFSEVQFIPAGELRAIDELWRQNSGGRYGYSVQRRIWRKAKGDFTRFFIRVGWMKKLEGCEVEQYNYRSFPGEFMWDPPEAEEGAAPPAPEGHLPLTNALRGTRLLESILTHPAFDIDDDDNDDGGDADEKMSKPAGKPLLGFKPNYTF
ncbi:Tetrapyrrole-binding protein- chloroplastic [Striga hermonthica]|uniref:Tetrapyrrole-binding protein- chloroplastic n=1 Tax=Striga hermonthica TaxID=68872 RepID=A0A9N7N0P9_STRHE|nr:Tetrapyrrole-binding protein- chloroplastic [Striga hermonthica]